jgi:hypothetical protein
MERSTSPTRPRSVRLLFFNLALALVAASIPCLAAEAVLRLLAFPSDTPGLFLKVASEVEWSGRPSSRGMFAGVPVAFNSLGLRDRERSMQRTPGTERILMLGDSMTFGMGVAEETLQHRSLLYAWVASRLGAAIRQLGAKGFGQVGKINDPYVDSN